MEWYSVPTEEPSVIFPIGAVIEDEKGIYKILKFEKQKAIHKYKVEVLKQKVPIPNEFKPFLDETYQTLLVVAQNLHAIRRVE